MICVRRRQQHAVGFAYAAQPSVYVAQPGVATYAPQATYAAPPMQQQQQQSYGYPGMPQQQQQQPPQQQQQQQFPQFQQPPPQNPVVGVAVAGARQCPNCRAAAGGSAFCVSCGTPLK